MGVITKHNYYKMLGLNLKPIPKAIMDCIVSFSDKKGRSYPSQDLIAEVCNINVRTVQRHIKILSEIKINNLPLLVIFKHRGEGQTFSNNLYLLPWITQSDSYIKARNTEIVEKLIKEWSEMLNEEFLNENKSTSQATNNLNIKERQNFNFIYISDKIKKLSNNLKLSTYDTFNFICKVGESIRSSRVYNVDKYLYKSLKGFKLSLSIEESISNIYNALCREDVFYSCLEEFRTI